MVSGAVSQSLMLPGLTEDVGVVLNDLPPPPAPIQRVSNSPSPKKTPQRIYIWSQNEEKKQPFFLLCA